MRRILFGLVIVSIFISGLSAVLPELIEAGLAHEAPWPMFLNDEIHEGRGEWSAPKNPVVKWEFTTGMAIYSSAVVGADGTIYLGSDDGFLYAVNPDGTERWRFPTGGEIHSVPALDEDGTIYFGSADGKFYALRQDGSKKWDYSTGGAIWSSPVICWVDDTICFGSDDGYVYGLMPDGMLKWKTQTDGSVSSSPVYNHSRQAVAVGSADGKFYQINVLTGNKIWVADLVHPIYSSPTYRSGDSSFFFIGASNGALYSIDGEGNQIWNVRLGDCVSSSPVLDHMQNLIFVGAYPRGIHAVEKDTGLIRWTARTDGPVYASPLWTFAKMLYIGSLDGNLYAVNTETGAVQWKFPLGGPIYSSCAMGDDGTLYVGCADGKLYAIGEAPAIVLIKPLGGEVLTAAATYEIRWASTFPSTENYKVEIRFSCDGADGPWSEPIVCPHSGSYLWVVPEMPTAQGCIKLTLVRADTGEVLGEALSDYFTVEAAGPFIFPDVPSDYWAFDEITVLAKAGIINGFPDGTYKPEFPVTRAQFAKMVLLTLSFAPEYPVEPTFPDVPPVEWYYGYVEGATKHGLMIGYPDGTFRPAGNITIGEILTVLVRVKNWPLTDPPIPPLSILLLDRDGSLGPITAQDWFYQYVGAAAAHGLIMFPDYEQIAAPGEGNGVYIVRFNSPASRAQTAVFLTRILD